MTLIQFSLSLKKIIHTNIYDHMVLFVFFHSFLELHQNWVICIAMALLCFYSLFCGSIKLWEDTDRVNYKWTNERVVLLYSYLLFVLFISCVCVAIYGICFVLFNFPFYLIWHDFNHWLLRYFMSDKYFQMQSTDQWNQLADSRWWWFNNQLASFSGLKMIHPLIWSKIKAIMDNYGWYWITK